MEESVILREGYARLKKTRTVFIGGLLALLVILVGVAVTLGSAGFTVGESYLAILAGSSRRPSPPPRWPMSSSGTTGSTGCSLRSWQGSGLRWQVQSCRVSSETRSQALHPRISSAAATGASVAIVLGAGFVGGEYLIIANAFLFALLASVAIYGMARYRGVSSETMILAGIALMYLFSAVTSLLQYVGTPKSSRRWSSGCSGRWQIHLAKTRACDPRHRLHRPLPHLPGLGPQRPRRR